MSRGLRNVGLGLITVMLLVPSVLAQWDLVYDQNISGLPDGLGQSFALFPSVGRYEYDNLTVWDGNGHVLFAEDFDGDMSQWSAIAGNWSFAGGVGVYDDDNVTGKLMANSVSLPDDYILQYSVRVTRHNPVFSYVDHLRVWMHYDLAETGGYDTGLRENGMANWFYSGHYSGGDFRTSSYYLDDTQLTTLRLERRDDNLKMYVVPEPCAVMFVSVGSLIVWRRKA